MLKRDSEAEVTVQEEEDEDVLKLSDNVIVMTRTAEQTALDQIKQLAQHPSFVNSRIVVQADVHAGMGCVIGFTATLPSPLSVCPNVIGVDIGCGVLAYNLGPINVNFHKLHEHIVKHVPNGFGISASYDHNFLNDVYSDMLADPTTAKFRKYMPRSLNAFMDEMQDTCSLIQQCTMDKCTRSLGSLGGGNHFIELNCDQFDDIWLVIHSGSRNPGLQIAVYFQKLAQYLLFGHGPNDQHFKKKDIQPYSAAITHAAGKVAKETAFLIGNHAEEYMKHMKRAQVYALLNRRAIARNILAHLHAKPKDSVESVHNYIDVGDGVIRKGAISAHEGERVIVPLNMKAGSRIGPAKDNKHTNNSAPHGAGRVLSRRDAKQQLLMSDYKADMDNVWSKTVSKGTLDECPRAYKPVDYIEKKLAQLITVTNVLSPVFNFKAGASDDA